MPERPAPLVLVATGGGAHAATPPPFGSYVAVAENGRRLLAAELSRRLGAAGAAVSPLEPREPPPGEAFHWGRWYTAAAHERLRMAREQGAAVDALGYAGAGALALAGDTLLDELLAPLPGEVVANNRFSADAFVVAGDLEAALAVLVACPADNGAARALEAAGFTARDLAGRAWSRFDVDTPLDLALLRLALRHPGHRGVESFVGGFLEMAQLPGGRGLEVPRAVELGAVIRDPAAELVVAGRVPAAMLGYLESQTACRVRAFVEERGMRSATAGTPRSLLSRVVDSDGGGGLVRALTALGDAVVLDTRVLMAAMAGSADTRTWPDAEERFAADFGDATHGPSAWLAELATAASSAEVPVLLGGHALVSDGLRILTEAAWLGH